MPSTLSAGVAGKQELNGPLVVPCGQSGALRAGGCVRTVLRPNACEGLPPVGEYSRRSVDLLVRHARRGHLGVGPSIPAILALLESPGTSGRRRSCLRQVQTARQPKVDVFNF